MDEFPLVGVLIGQASDREKSEGVREFFSKCPYCVASTCKDKNVFVVLAVPAKHKWWLESIKAQPKGTVGLEKADVFFTDTVQATSPWSAGLVEPALDKSPCGADCQGCPVYRKNCGGCPATKHYTK